MPRGIEEKLAETDWPEQDVIVGSLRNKGQLETCMKHKFYHIPVEKVKESDLPIYYVAIYQAINIFGRKVGIRY